MANRTMTGREPGALRTRRDRLVAAVAAVARTGHQIPAGLASETS